jgi:hypothetical protein
MVAVEIPDLTAAVMLDQGRTVLMATPAELAALARRQKRFLATLIQPRPPAANGERSTFSARRLLSAVVPDGVC